MCVWVFCQFTKLGPWNVVTVYIALKKYMFLGWEEDETYLHSKCDVYIFVIQKLKGNSVRVFRQFAKLTPQNVVVFCIALKKYVFHD